MQLRIQLDRLAEHGTGRSAAFLDAVRARGVVDGTVLVVDSAVWIDLVKEHTDFKRRGLGDLVEKAVKPFAKAIHHPCLDADDKLKPGSPCDQMKAALNKAVPRL